MCRETVSCAEATVSFEQNVINISKIFFYFLSRISFFSGFLFVHEEFSSLTNSALDKQWFIDKRSFLWQVHSIKVKDVNLNSRSKQNADERKNDLSKEPHKKRASTIAKVKYGRLKRQHLPFFFLKPNQVRWRRVKSSQATSRQHVTSSHMTSIHVTSFQVRERHVK